MAHALVVMSLLLAQADALQGARGSSDGVWGYADIGPALRASVIRPTSTSSELSGLTNLVGGWGLQLGERRFVVSAAFSLSLDSTISPPGEAKFRWSSLMLRTALVDALFDRSVTGLRLTPVLGIDVPTHGADIGPYLAGIAGFRLERRFGPVELAYRATATAAFLIIPQPGQNGFAPTPPNRRTEAFSLIHTLFTEWWVVPDVSLALGLGFGTQWVNAHFDGAGGLGDVQTVGHFTSGLIAVNYAFSKYVGAGFEIGSPHVSVTGATGQPQAPFFSVTSFTTSFALWLRTDPQLQRNWLDR